MPNQNVVELLKMYNKPEIWPDQSIADEINMTLENLPASGTELTQRGRYLMSELTKGLMLVVEATLKKTTDNNEKDVLLATVVDILSFLHYLGEEVSPSKLN